MSKQISYNLVIDKDRDKMLSSMFAFCIMIHGDDFVQFMKAQGTAFTFQDFIKEKADKNHELGFCEDPNCEHNG